MLSTPSRSLIPKRLAGTCTLIQASWVPARSFGRFKPPPKYTYSGDLDKFFKDEKESFEENISKRERLMMQAQRMAFLEINRKPEIMDRLWWNKVVTLSNDDLEMMPLGFTIKYGTFVQKIHEAQLFATRELSQDTENRYEVIKHLDKLKTNAEYEAI